MTKIRIDAPRCPWITVFGAATVLVRESDWRKILAVVQAANENSIDGFETGSNLGFACERLRAHLDKRRAKQ